MIQGGHRTLWSSVALFLLLPSAMHVASLFAYAVAALAPFLREDLALDRAELGWVVGTCYLVGAGASPGAGFLADALSGRRTMALLFSSSALAFAVFAVADRTWVLVLAAAIAGAPLALANPGTNRLLTAHRNVGERGLLLGVKQSGVLLGGVVAGAVLAPVAATAGWRVSVALVTLASVSIAAIVPRVLPRHDSRPVDGESRLDIPVNTLGWLTIYSLLLGVGIASVHTYLPLYAHETLGFSAPLAGMVLALSSGVGIASRILWGRSVERTPPSAAHLAVIAGLGVLAVFGLFLAEQLGTVALLAAVLAWGIGPPAWSVVIFLALFRLSPSGRTGGAAGWVVSGFFLGFVVGAPTTGYLVDASGTYGYAWLLLVGVFATAALLAIVGRGLLATEH